MTTVLLQTAPSNPPTIEVWQAVVAAGRPPGYSSDDGTFFLTGDEVSHAAWRDQRIPTAAFAC